MVFGVFGGVKPGSGLAVQPCWQLGNQKARSDAKLRRGTLAAYQRVWSVYQRILPVYQRLRLIYQHLRGLYQQTELFYQR